MFATSALLVLLAVSSIECNMISFCTEDKCIKTYLDIAIDMITKLKLDNQIGKDCDDDLQQKEQKAVDCADILNMGYNKSGVYEVRPMSRFTDGKLVKVYCDMETDGGGWTVIQRRGDFGSPKDFFFKEWKYYKEGFGDLTKDFWLGNDNIFALTNQKLYSAWVDLKSWEQEKRYASYENFWLDDEDYKYTLHISGYKGDAGDSMTPADLGYTQTTNKVKFSTKDQDNDNSRTQHCAKLYKGGWWYNACHYSNLNGLYHKGKHQSYADGVNWNTWKGYQYSLEWTEIKIRPKNYRRSTDLRFSNPTSTLVL